VILVFDTETSGFVQHGLPYDHPQQCHLVELGAILAEDDGTERACLSMIVKPDGWTIPPDAAAIHGITQEMALRCGVEVAFVVCAFANLLDNATLALAYNMPFDKDVMSLELLRLGEQRPVEWPTDIGFEDILDSVTPVVDMPPTRRMLASGRTGPKKPKLGEAYRHFFGEELESAHSALADARAALKVWLRVRDG